MCVLEIDKTLTKLDGVKKIANISNYHSVKFQENGALYKEFFDIGPGKFYSYNGCHIVSHFFVVYKVTCLQMSNL